MGQAGLLIPAAAALLAVTAFLLALAGAAGRLRATKRVAEFLRAKEEARERRLSLQGRRSASALDFRKRFVILQRRPKPTPTAAKPSTAASAGGRDQGSVADEVKRDPGKAAAVLKSLIQT